MSDKVELMVRTPVVRLSFPNLLTARKFEDKSKGITGQPRFSTDFLLEPTDLEKFSVLQEDKSWKNVNVKVVIGELAAKFWPSLDLNAHISTGALKLPLKDGTKIAAKRKAEGKKHSEVTEGKFVLSAASKEDFAPQLWVLEDGKPRELFRDKDKDRILRLFAGGQYVVAGIKLKPNETPQGKFVNAYINSVMYVKPGERIGGGVDAAVMFAGIEGGEADFDPTAGAEIAL